MYKVAFVLTLDEKSSEVLNQDYYVDTTYSTDKEVTEVLAPLALKMWITG